MSIGGGPIWSTQWGEGSLTSSLMDMDGDGLVDIAISGSNIYYKNISGNGKIQFKEVYIGAEGMTDTSTELSSTEENAYHATYYIQRPFRMWKAPYDGEVRIEQKIKK
ncbi:VCBS repeat-containing protein [Brucepastera parasyntrophica]|uniref:FG-GAP repeat domain-containing protein n=1 Tax=Brucepastera parasyntrophica TaxID=2880008 RepID=UPI002108B061|nr:VCBS repeat-containing protein [Brucepastera parasyntrophica]ULQ59045.1 VCBS repeat-containing protein [Brucepastera parasyntrophica]